MNYVEKTSYQAFKLKNLLCDCTWAQYWFSWTQYCL